MAEGIGYGGINAGANAKAAAQKSAADAQAQRAQEQAQPRNEPRQQAPGVELVARQAPVLVLVDEIEELVLGQLLEGLRPRLAHLIR